MNTSALVLPVERIKTELERLRQADPRLEVFGAGAHQYALRSPLSESDVAAAEQHYGVRFPQEYRCFLLEVGAGGAGPFYGVFPLVKQGTSWVWEGDGGDMCSDLRRPFPHDQAWNLDGHPLWDSEPDEDDPRFDSESFDDAIEAWTEAFEEVYWSPKWTAGAICICHHGCALRTWLVVTGPERGNVWYDGTADRAGLRPHVASDGSHMSFGAWYEEWIERSLAEFTASGC